MRATSKRNLLIIGAVIVVVALVAYVKVRQARQSAEVHFDTATVDRGKIVSKVTATGTLSALVTVQVGSQVSGRLQQIFVDYNSPVKKGEVVAKIDPQLFEAAYAQAKANFVAAQGNLEKAKFQAIDAERQYQRSKSLAERKLIAQADLDTAQATADAAKAQVEALKGNLEQAKAGLHQAEVNLAYTTISSPINGTVISRNVDVGQTVAASLQAPTLFLIAEDLKKMQVDTSVAEGDIGRLKAGMTASFTVDAYPNDHFVGTVRQIRNAPTTVQNVVTYDAVIDIDNPELKLRPGMTANVTFIVAERDDAVRVPNAALRFRPPADLLAQKAKGTQGATGQTSGAGGSGGGRGAWRTGGGERPQDADDWRVVWVLENDNPKPVRIKTGITDGSYTEVVEGDLEPGAKVITDASGGSADSRANGTRGGFPGRPF